MNAFPALPAHGLKTIQIDATPVGLLLMRTHDAYSFSSSVDPGYNQPNAICTIPLSGDSAFVIRPIPRATSTQPILGIASLIDTNSGWPRCHIDIEPIRAPRSFLSYAGDVPIGTITITPSGPQLNTSLPNRGYPRFNLYDFQEASVAESSNLSWILDAWRIWGTIGDRESSRFLIAEFDAQKLSNVAPLPE